MYRFLKKDKICLVAFSQRSVQIHDLYLYMTTLTREMRLQPGETKGKLTLLYEFTYNIPCSDRQQRQSIVCSLSNVIADKMILTRIC